MYDFAIIYNTSATFRGLENHNFMMFFWNPVLGWLLEPILIILAYFWVSFGDQFGYFWDTLFTSIFGCCLDTPKVVVTLPWWGRGGAVPEFVPEFTPPLSPLTLPPYPDSKRYDPQVHIGC